MKFFILLSCLLAGTTAVANQNLLKRSSVDILDPGILSQLDRPGEFSFATLMENVEGEKDFIAAKSADTLQLSRSQELSLQSPRFQSLTSVITRDVDEIRKASGEKMAFSSEEAEKIAPQGNVARHFDPYWLTSARSAYPLVAVVYRPDKEDDHSCGEVRFIYRLSYEHRVSRSSLPLFFNAVFSYDRAGDCSGVAALWNNWKSTGTNLSSLFDRNLIQFRQLELNMQIVRYPSGQKTDFGGQAVYLFRIFKAEGSGFVPVPLENTPDIAAISKDRSLKDALIGQLTDPKNATKIDQGTFILENSQGKLLAKRAISFSTSGRSRLGNKLFTVLLGKDPVDLDALDLKNFSFIKTKRGFVERLNNMTCVGCHQSGGTAGFHMLGATEKYNSTFNQVILPVSPHYYAERVRREAYVKALVSHLPPARMRPPSFYPEAEWSAGSPRFKPAKVRDLCVPVSDYSTVVSCEPGSTCRISVKNNGIGVDVGECVANVNTTPGHICRDGRITNAPVTLNAGDISTLFATKDSIDVNTVHTTGPIACGNPSGGVPLGRISAVCDSATPSGKLVFVDSLLPGQKPPKQICAMRGGPQFDECAKSANPPDCLKNAKIVRALLDSCSEGNFCREDYICQKLPEDVARLYTGQENALMRNRIRKLGELGIGFCVPNYFVFNMRTDGHLVPEGRK